MTWKPTGGWCMRIEELGSLEPEVGTFLGADVDGSWAIQDAPTVRSTLSLMPGTDIPSLDESGKVPTGQLPPFVTLVAGRSGEVDLSVSDVADAADVSDTRFPTSGQKAALAGTGTPGSGDVYVNNSDSRLTNSRAPTGAAGGDLGDNYPNPTVESINGISKSTLTSRLPSTDQVAALAGTQGTPNNYNRFVTNDDTRLGAASTGNPRFRGLWNANTDSPVLSATSPSEGDFYIVTTHGTSTYGGVNLWDPHDWIMYRGGGWIKLDFTPTSTPTGNKVVRAPSSGKLDAWVSGASTLTPGMVTIAADAESTSLKVPASNDSRLSDARIPSGSAGGDFSGTFPNPTIGAAAVTYSKFQNVAALSVVGRSGNSIATAAAITASSDGDVLRRSGTTLGFGAIPQSSVTSLTTDISAKAPSASPTFIGTPAAPTASVDTNTTQVATTAYVLAQAASATPAALGTAAVGTSTRYARADHVHPGVGEPGALGYQTAPSTPQDASHNTTYLPVVYGATSGECGGPFWSKTADGTHPIYGKIRRGMKAATDYCGVGLWTGADGKVVLAYKAGTGYQLAHAQAQANLPALVGSAIHIPPFAWEGALANGNTYKFYGSVDGYRWIELFSINITASPYSDTSANFVGFFVQGTAELMIERSIIG